MDKIIAELPDFFDNLKLHQKVTEGIKAMGFASPTPIQQQAVPAILAGSDVIGCAQTGTGKTAAFLIPVIQNYAQNPVNGTSALIIVPTRELTVQIDRQLQGLGYFAGISSKAVYGGGDGVGWELEKQALISGCDVIIGTPGKLIQHMNMGYVELQSLKFLILDEADRMLDMGFFDDIIRILSYVPKNRQNLLFSATMPPRIRELARKIMSKPVEINIAPAKPAEGVKQEAYLVNDANKTKVIAKILGETKLNSVLIFAATKIGVRQLRQALNRLPDYKVKEMHSDLTQEERESTLNGFRNREFEILVATDILSRGIDIENIDLVINFNVPQDAEDYVHRVGRTARADKSGKAVTLINGKESEAFKRIERLIGYELTKSSLGGKSGKKRRKGATGSYARRSDNKRKPGFKRRDNNKKEEQ